MSSNEFKKNNFHGKRLSEKPLQSPVFNNDGNHSAHDACKMLAKFSNFRDCC